MTDDDRYQRCAADQELAAEIGDRYGLGRPTSWRDLGGSWTTNMMLEFADGNRVARIHRDWTSADRLASLQAVRHAIADGGIPTVLPLPDEAGDTVITLANGRLAELEPYVDWNQRMNVPDRLRIGLETLGRIHDVLRTADIPEAAATVPYANHLHSWEAARLTRSGADRMKTWDERALDGYADAVVRHIETVTVLEAELADDQLRQLVHGDFWDNNVLFADERLAAVIDFDFMAERWRIDDLALTIWFFLLEPGRGLPDADDRRLVAGLVDRYDAGTTVPLSAAERRALPLAIARQPAWSAGRWILQNDEDDARKHARAAAEELPVAARVLQDLDPWQQALIN